MGLQHYLLIGFSKLKQLYVSSVAIYTALSVDSVAMNKVNISRMTIEGNHVNKGKQIFEDILCLPVQGPCGIKVPHGRSAGSRL